jgi:hypothetical protein
MHTTPSAPPAIASERPQGIAIIVATLCMAITMSLHPSGSQLLNQYAEYVRTNILAHGLALFAIPFTLMGAAGITRRLRRAGASGSADLAGATYLVSNVAVLIAGTASGLIAPAIAARLQTPDPATEAVWRTLFRFTGIVNQSFAMLYVVGLALSVLVWSFGIWRSAAFARWIAVFGTILSVALLVLLVVSRANLDVHTFGLVVLLQGAWMVAIAWQMLRRVATA